MDLGIDGKVALVTGSSKGLGRASAASLSREGANVVLCARDGAELARAEHAMAGEALSIVADVTDPAAPQRLAEAAVARFGGLDILVANAGGPPPARALEFDDAALQAALEANLLTSIRLVRAAVPHMRRAGWGRIVLLTSRTIKQPNPALALSNTARTGLWAWAKTAAQDLFDDGITLNLACPGSHATDRAIELGLEGPMGDPDHFGEVVAFLCSAQADFVTGSAVQVDGGEILGLL
ncbi:MAG: SDR family oxidoreductase [Actinomycetota bacterium]